MKTQQTIQNIEVEALLRPDAKPIIFSSAVDGKKGFTTVFGVSQGHNKLPSDKETMIKKKNNKNVVTNSQVNEKQNALKEPKIGQN